MKRIFEEKHIACMLAFMKKHLPAQIRPDIGETKQAIKLLTLMDAGQNRLLSIYFDDLDESTATEELRKMGFESHATTAGEKKDILNQTIRTRLVGLITHNNTLLDEEDLFDDVDETMRKKKVFDGFTGYKKIMNKATRAGFRKRLKEVKLEFSRRSKKLKTNAFGTIVPKRTPFLNLYDENEVSYQLSTKNLPVLTGDPNEEEDVPPPEDVVIRKKGSKSKAVSIYDLVDDSNVILRKRKILSLDPAGPIDYHGRNEFKLKSTEDDIRAMPETRFKSRIYKKFGLRSFVEDILYTKNNIESPQGPKFKTPKEFREYIKGDKYFFRYYIVKHIARLLMGQDKYLAYSDAKMIAIEIRENLQMQDYEYFYGLYFKSADFLPNQR